MKPFAIVYDWTYRAFKFCRENKNEGTSDDLAIQQCIAAWEMSVKRYPEESVQCVDIFLEVSNEDGAFHWSFSAYGRDENSQHKVVCEKEPLPDLQGA